MYGHTVDDITFTEIIFCSHFSLEAGYYNEEYSKYDVGNSNKVPKPN